MILHASWAPASEVRHRLALGLEWLDGVTEQRIATPLLAELQHVGPLDFDQVLIGKGGGRQVVHYAKRFKKYFDHCVVKGFSKELEIVVHSAVDGPHFEDRRIYVPRRLQVTLKLDAQNQPLPMPANIRRPYLWPGATYPVAGNTTGVRGRALKGPDAKTGLPLRWVRVLASIPFDEPDLTKATIVGYAHGDDRGEFLLLVESNAIPTTTITGPLKVRLTLHVPPVLPPPADVDSDPLWDVPLEDVGDVLDSPALQGKAVPAGFSEPANSAKEGELTLGQVLSGDDFQFLIP
jgi:hypothetical protein